MIPILLRVAHFVAVLYLIRWTAFFIRTDTLGGLVIALPFQAIAIVCLVLMLRGLRQVNSRRGNFAIHALAWTSTLTWAAAYSEGPINRYVFASATPGDRLLSSVVAISMFCLISVAPFVTNLAVERTRNPRVSNWLLALSGAFTAAATALRMVTPGSNAAVELMMLAALCMASLSLVQMSRLAIPVALLEALALPLAVVIFR